jgi:hypothetical protein
LQSKDVFVVGLSNGERMTGFIDKGQILAASAMTSQLLPKVQPSPSSKPRLCSCHIQR